MKFYYSWNRLLAVTVLLSVANSISSYSAYGANISAKSCSYSDVAAAYTSASVGDVITVPAGNCTWSNTLEVTKAVTLMGAGSNSTFITNSMGSGYSLIDITPASDAYLTRVSSFNFQLGTINNGRRAITVGGKLYTSFVPTKIRIDNNSVTGGGGNEGAIVTMGKVDGVIDHNIFTNVYCAIFGWGINYDNEAWADAFAAKDIFAGTSDAMFVENNKFILNDKLGTRATVDAQVYIQEGGASYVVRYNTFDASAVVDPNYIELMYNNHGNQDYCENYPGTCFRGMPIFESYNNTATCSATNCEFMAIRGGSVLIHDETFLGAASAYSILEVNEEECWQTIFFPKLRTAWPAQDQVTNSFYWNNTFNGATITDVDIAPDNNYCTANFVKKDRDYFMHPPQASGGRTVFTGLRFGGSNTAPTTGDIGSMVFNSSGANAYYPYTPYIYPHPLAAGSISALAAPTGLRVIM
ncbi:MAG: hypothetical protein ACXVCP_16455 [Bdellovibrio sp.]